MRFASAGCWLAGRPTPERALARPAATPLRVAGPGSTIPAMPPLPVRIAELRPAEGAEWLAMRVRLWPDGGMAEHEREVAAFFAGSLVEPLAVLVARSEDGTPVGFAELSIRGYVDGCETRDVGYLEGWYVEEAYRRQGVGRALVEASIAWARARGCREFASDTEVENRSSIAAHLALGFEETARVVLFRRVL